METPSGLKYRDIRVGDGAQPNKGNVCCICCIMFLVKWLVVCLVACSEKYGIIVSRVLCPVLQDVQNSVMGAEFVAIY